MEFSENNDNTDLLIQIDGDTSQQQSNPNRGNGESNGGLRPRLLLDYRYEESQRGSCKVLLERLANSDLANKDLDRIK